MKTTAVPASCVSFPVVVEPYHVYAEDTRVVLGGTAVIKAVFPKSKRHYVRVKSWYKGRDKVNIGGR